MYISHPMHMNTECPRGLWVTRQFDRGETLALSSDLIFRLITLKTNISSDHNEHTTKRLEEDGDRQTDREVRQTERKTERQRGEAALALTSLQ